MAYFSSESDRDVFEKRFCCKCVHYDAYCAVLALHDSWNDEQEPKSDATSEIIQCGIKKKALASLISESKTRCFMFSEVVPEPLVWTRQQEIKDEVRKTVLGENYFEL